MASRGDPAGPLDLYSELRGRKVADRLNATTRRTQREVMLEVLLIAVMLEQGNGELRFPKDLIDQADMARVRDGRRLEARFDGRVTYEYVLKLTRPPATEPEQQEFA